MVTYKNIRIPKRGGGTRLQRVQVLKSGKYKFVKNIGKSKARRSSSRTTTKTKRKRSVAKKKKRSNRRSFTLPMAVVGGIAASPAIRDAVAKGMEGDLNAALQHLGRLAGFWDGKFQMWRLLENTGPIVIGCLVHKLMSKLGVNRMIARAGIPVFRI